MPRPATVILDIPGKIQPPVKRPSIQIFDQGTIVSSAVARCPIRVLIREGKVLKFGGYFVCRASSTRRREMVASLMFCGQSTLFDNCDTFA